MKNQETRMQSNRPEQALIARSPEGFPDLNIYPKGWDLEHTSPHGKKTRRSKNRSKMITFPKTTDSYL